MCSVVGYIGKDLSRDFILDGLSRLEYRGYDSAGYACINPDDQRILYAKSPGKLSQLVDRLKKEPIDGFAGIGHTRWSTHGESTEYNAHPHFDCERSLSIVHNGIIENHHELKHKLESDAHTFHSDTDTEIIAHLFESYLAQSDDFKSALVALVSHGRCVCVYCASSK